MKIQTLEQIKFPIETLNEKNKRFVEELPDPIPNLEGAKQMRSLYEGNLGVLTSLSIQLESQILSQNEVKFKYSMGLMEEKTFLKVSANYTNWLYKASVKKSGTVAAISVIKAWLLYYGFSDPEDFSGGVEVLEALTALSCEVRGLENNEQWECGIPKNKGIRAMLT